MSGIEFKNIMQRFERELFATPTRVMSFQEARQREACKESARQHLRHRASEFRLREIGLRPPSKEFA